MERQTEAKMARRDFCGHIFCFDSHDERDSVQYSNRFWLTSFCLAQWTFGDCCTGEPHLISGFRFYDKTEPNRPSYRGRIQAISPCFVVTAGMLISAY